MRALLESYVEDEIFTDVSRGVSSPRLAPSLLSFRVSLADDALLGEVARYPGSSLRSVSFLGAGTSTSFAVGSRSQTKGTMGEVPQLEHSMPLENDFGR